MPRQKWLLSKQISYQRYSRRGSPSDWVDDGGLSLAAGKTNVGYKKRDDNTILIIHFQCVTLPFCHLTQPAKCRSGQGH